MSNIVYLPITTLDIPVERVLDRAKASSLDVVFVLGREPDGTPYFAGSTSDIGALLVLVEQFKKEHL